MLSLQVLWLLQERAQNIRPKLCCTCACFLLIPSQPQTGQRWVSVQRRVKVEAYSSFLFAVTKMISATVVDSVMPHSDPYSKKD